MRLDFDRGAMAYVSRRRLGHIGIVEDPEAFFRARRIGPDALDLTEADFLDRLGGRRGGVKSALMNQTVMAGIGNVYADEILFQANLHPRTRLSGLDRRHREALYHALRRVLMAAVEAGAGSERFGDRVPNDFLLPHRREGGHCPRCGHAVRRVQAAGRRSYFCARCQPENG
jgi:formamidopyrimidine-DNA glycosylase